MSAHLNGKVHVEPEWALRLIESRTEEFYRLWPWVRAGVEKILAGSDGFYKIIPEEVYVSLYRKWSFLYTIERSGVAEGWTILQSKKDDITGEPYLLIWMGSSDTTEAKERYFVEIEKMARAKDAFKAIRFHSARAGWERKPPGPGWRIVERTLEKRLD